VGVRQYRKGVQQMQANTEYVREVRSALDGRIAYEAEAGERCNASWMDVSRDGARVALGRYLRPGRVIAIAFTAPHDGRTEVSLQARVIWCRQGGGSAEFHAGLQVIRETPAAALAFASLVRTARNAANKAKPGAVLNTVWPNFRLVQDRQPQPEVMELRSMAV